VPNISWDLEEAFINVKGPEKKQAWPFRKRLANDNLGVKAAERAREEEGGHAEDFSGRRTGPDERLKAKRKGDALGPSGRCGKTRTCCLRRRDCKEKRNLHGRGETEPDVVSRRLIDHPFEGTKGKRRQRAKTFVKASNSLTERLRGERPPEPQPRKRGRKRRRQPVDKITNEFRDGGPRL